MPTIDDAAWPMVEEAILRLYASLPAGEHLRLDQRLAEMGWEEIESEYPIESVELLFRAQGRHLAQTDCLDRVMLAELRPVLRGAADSVLLPLPGTVVPDRQQVTGIVLGPLHGRVAIPVLGPHSATTLAVVDAHHLRGVALDTFDPTTRWTRVWGPRPITVSVDATREWHCAIAAAHRALATELTAVTEQTLQIAVKHVAVRTQFGTAIGAFQSPRHLLADAWADLAAAQALTTNAWRYGGLLSAQVAKAAAGRAHRIAADAAMQVCGAIGLTAEHPLHRYVTRGVQLDALCGSYRQLETQLAEQLFATDEAQAALPAVITCG